MPTLYLTEDYTLVRCGSGETLLVETILGLEGASSAAYFRCFGKLLSDPRQWPFPGRVKRPPTDPVNALLSFGYALLTTRVASAVQLVGFDHFVGYLRISFYGCPALALDLMEEFRPLIVDSVVLNMLNNRMLAKIPEEQRHFAKPGRRRGDGFRRGLDDHYSIGATGHICLLDGNTLVLFPQRGTYLGLTATDCSLVAQSVGTGCLQHCSSIFCTAAFLVEDTNGRGGTKR